jgi:hypothetical protein
MSRVNHTSHRATSICLARAISLLNRASEQLQAARQTSADRYHRNELHDIALSLRGVRLPLSRIASALESGCGQ